MTERIISDARISPLGVVGRTTCSIARTSRPWLLDIDGLVVSVGGGLGGLGRALLRAIPDAPWSTARYEQIRPDQPQLLELDESTTTGAGSALRSIILATPHGDGPISDPTMRAIEIATASAVIAAAGAGVHALGVPLLASGVLQIPAADAAAAAIPAVVGVLRSSRTQPLERLLFICEDNQTEDVIRHAFTEIVRGSRGSTPETGDASAGAPQVGSGSGSTAESTPSEYLAGGISSDLVDPSTGIGLDKDRLGVSPYVSMLATVIADRSTPMPLSIGIFGAWGLGKSYFMGLLRTQVDELARSPTKAYCDDIVQIGFNAWHYSDSNLWASLGDEIFRQLAGPAPGTDVDGRRERIRRELTHKLGQRSELEAAAHEAEHQAARLQREIDGALADRDRYAVTLIRALRDSASVRHRLGRIWSLLGIADEVEQGRSLAEQLRGSFSEANALRRSIMGRQGLLLAGIASAAILCFAGAAVVAPELRSWLSGSGFASLAVLLGCALGAVGRIRSGIGMLRELTDELRVASAARQEAAVADAMAALRDHEVTKQVAEAQLESVISQVGELQRELVELTPGRRLYGFLADRANGDSYTRNLGLISTIRKDFEELVALMDRWRRAGTADTPRPVDRIVLYIDDLDRCSPRQVVDVLQAVHLLLALELFVVVVGVDPRWLLRALCHHYDEFLDMAGDDRNGSHVTPEDYLEKILNIPLALPGMAPGALRQVIHGLVENDEESQPGPEQRAGPAPLPATTEPRTDDLWPEPGQMPIESGSEVAALQQSAHGPGTRPLTRPELDLLASLDGLVRTPREAKRLVNLYRMLRSTRDLSDASTFLGEEEKPGEYEAVALLLGLLTSHASLLGAVLDDPADPTAGTRGGLMHRPATGSWSEFLADMAPRRSGEAWVNDVVGPIEPDAVPEWLRMTSGLERASREVTFTDLSTLQRWAPRVRRFSFALPSLDDRRPPPRPRERGAPQPRSRGEPAPAMTD